MGGDERQEKHKKSTFREKNKKNKMSNTTFFPFFQKDNLLVYDILPPYGSGFKKRKKIMEIGRNRERIIDNPLVFDQGLFDIDYGFGLLK